MKMLYFEEWWRFYLNITREFWLGIMMTSSNGNIFRVTGPLCGEFTGQRWIPLTKASDAELWCFLWYLHWISGWLNNREAGDLRRHRAHYNVIVMMTGNYHKSSLHSWRRKHVTSHQSLGLLFWFPVLKSIHCNAFHDRTLLNVLYLSDTGK